MEFLNKLSMEQFKLLTHEQIYQLIHGCSLNNSPTDDNNNIEEII